MRVQMKPAEGKQELLDKAYQLGLEYERSKHYCAQCTVAALQEALQIKDEGLFRAAHPLSAGVGETTDGSCGGLSGGAMILGYLYGRGKEDFEGNTSDKGVNYLVKELYDRFIQEYGSCRCKDIHMKVFGRSYDLWNDDEKQAFEEAGAHVDKCPVVVAKACTWTIEIIQKERSSS